MLLWKKRGRKSESGGAHWLGVRVIGDMERESILWWGKGWSMGLLVSFGRLSKLSVKD